MRRALVVTLGLVASALASSSSQAAPTPVVIGVHYMDVKSTGGLNPTGEGEMPRAVEGFRTWINAHGGLGGHRLDIDLRGSKYPVFVADQANELQRVCDDFVAKHVFAAVLGQPSRPLVTCLAKHGIVVIADSQAADESLFAQLRGRYYSPGGVAQERLGRALATNAVRAHLAGPATKIAVLHYADPDLSPGAAAAVAQFRRLGRLHVQDVVFSDPVTAVQTLQQDGVQLVVIVENGSSVSLETYPVAASLSYAPTYLISGNSDPAGLRSIAPPTQLELTRVLSWHEYDVQEVAQEEPPALGGVTKICEQAAAANGWVAGGRTENSVAGRLCDGLMLLRATFSSRRITSPAQFDAAVRAIRGYTSPAAYGTDLRIRPDGATVARLLNFTTGAGCLCWRYLGPASL